MASINQITNDGDKWSSDDVQTLKVSFGKVPVAELSFKLGRTEDAIMKQLSRLNLRCKKPWSEEEDRLVIEPAHKPAFLAKLLGRSKDSIRHRKRKLSGR